MTSRLRLILFDVDGTLVDSQHAIVASVTQAFELFGLAVPTRAQILSIVGLSLPEAMARLAPTIAPERRAQMVERYKQNYQASRLSDGALASPLYDGARAALERLQRDPWALLGVATGKSRRGLDHLMAAHELAPYFVTRQCADDHPSKPHPSMVETALAETGVAPGDCVMIGDTSYDMDMARAAGVRGIGVGWGYHRRETLVQSGARVVLDRFADLDAALARIWEDDHE